MKLDPGMRRRRMADAQAKLTRAEELEAQAKALRAQAARTAHVWQFEIRFGTVYDPCGER